jgi:2-polyprenyl-6-methoxyphenol hydroxylase-like FAD-dependent oxidoreductase
MQRCDVVVVGAGIAGSALGAALAREGLEVVILEATEEYEDRVRGESLVPWGVAEARALGAEDVLLEAGALESPVWIRYSPEVPVELARSEPIPVGMLRPGVTGALNLRHPVACQALTDAAAQAGCTVHRGARDVVVTAGPEPTVRWRTPTGPGEAAARLVVGADGRASTVRRQSGIALGREPETHMIAGVLVDAAGIPPSQRHDFLACERGIFMASFFQSPELLRVYLCPGVAQRHRFSGPGGLAEFRRATRYPCIPFADELAAAEPVGPLATYPGDHTTTVEPFVPGVVLVGDAAGYSSPIVGQGLAGAMRDARTVRDVVVAGDVGPAAFAGYAAERGERMRRLRDSAEFVAAAFAADGTEDDQAGRRVRFLRLLQEDPAMLGLVASYHAGPETSPPAPEVARLTAAVRGAA